MRPDEFGRQGGEGVDPAGLDLSTCINAYGPPPEVLEEVSGLTAGILRLHPYDAASQLESVYAQYLRCQARELVAERGASGLIWRLATIFNRDSVAIPLPGYTEFFRAFPNAVRMAGDGESISVEQLEHCMHQSELTLFANPLNPSGRFIEREVLVGLLADHPKSILAIDESYIDFFGDHHARSMIGASQPNVIVLRSPSKFYGMGGVRAGVAWSTDRLTVEKLRAAREPWPVSMISASLVSRALGAETWARHVRVSLTSDAEWLDQWLVAQDCSAVEGDLHFRLVTKSPAGFPDTLRDFGIYVRCFGPAHGVPAGSWRIAAPRNDSRSRLKGATAG